MIDEPKGRMRCLDLTLPTLEQNIALDEALLLQAESSVGGEVLRFWLWPAPAVVLGAGSRVAMDVNELACRTDDIPIRRRSSGGGTVLLGQGCLLFSLVLSYDRSQLLREVRSSYQHILGKLCPALDGLLPDISMAGTSDLAAAGQKFSGNSQQRKRRFLLHHGTMLYDFDLSLIDRYLYLPERQPDYRQARPHAAFLGNLGSQSEDLKRRLRSIWDAHQELTAWPEEAVRQLVQEKYSQTDWIFRR
jgi:lipoate-protein ligase A